MNPHISYILKFEIEFCDYISLSEYSLEFAWNNHNIH